MPSVVFLRAVNVGGTNRCRPAVIAKQLSKFGLLNIGAVGTFVVRKDVSEAALRAALARKLPFKCEIMICPARDVIRIVSKNPFPQQPSGPDITAAELAPIYIKPQTSNFKHPNFLSVCPRTKTGC